jgi:hypothetical protein
LSVYYDAEGADRAGNILHVMGADVLEAVIGLALDLLEGAARETDAAGLG